MWDLAHQRQQQRQAKLGDGRVTAGLAAGREQRDALRGGGLCVDVWPDTARLRDRFSALRALPPDKTSITYPDSLAAMEFGPQL